ncbi:MAG TPA: peptidoglycan-associated lipoprotein Pal [Candidatus Binatia bacterium]
MDRLNALLCGFFICAFLLLAGCSKTATTPTGPDAGLSGSDNLGPGKGAAGSNLKENPTGAGSLSEAQKGRGTETPPTSPLKEVYFEFDSFNLNDAARTILRTNAEWIKANPTVRVEIEGHCDERGTNEYNLALGAKRAQAAKDYLVTLGIGADRLSTISYGEELPVCKEQTEDCWKKNRRDRFVITAARPAS